MKNVLTAIPVWLVLLLAAPAPAQVTPVRLDQQVAAYANQMKFNGSVLVVKNGVPVLDKGYGMANYEWGIPNGPDTKFRLGSITKQFTGMLIAQLEQQGKLSVSDPVSKHIPDTPGAWQAITIHHLLTHSSGIPNFTSFPDYQKTMMLKSPPAESMKRFRDKPLDFDPGTKMSYSNSGYILLGWIVERASGMSYEDALKKMILEPLKMSDTGYDHGETVLEHRAAGYERGRGGLRNASFIDMSIPHGAGALYSTTGDLRKWSAALSTEKLLPKEALERYFTPFKNDYAYGWSVKTENGLKTRSHGGGINGFATMITEAPEEKVLVVTLSNVVPSEAGRLANDLLKLTLGGDVALPKARTEITVAPATLAQYVGEYPLSPTFVLTVTLEEGQLMTQATGQSKIPIFAETETRFFLKVVDATITFQKDSTGKVTGLVLSQGGREMPAPKKP